MGDQRINRLVLAFAVVFIVSGLAFKLGVAPFHMWVPDVYQGAPTAVIIDDCRRTKGGGFCIVIPLIGGWLAAIDQ